MKKNKAELLTVGVFEKGLGTLRKEFKGDTGALRSEFKDGLVEIKNEFKGDMDNFRTKIKGDLKEQEERIIRHFDAVHEDFESKQAFMAENIMGVHEKIDVLSRKIENKVDREEFISLEKIVKSKR